MSTDNAITTASEFKFSQAKKTVHQIPITKPHVNDTSKLIYIENALNNDSKEKFTYVTKIQTEVGENYYGVKRLPFFIYDGSDDDYKPQEKNNINADVVVLTPSSKQEQIYSFKNGAQYMELSQYALNMARDNKGKIIPHYIHSYEYIIDGDIPENSSSYNLKFCGSVGYIANASSLSQLCPVDEIPSLLNANMTDEEKIETIKGLYTYSFSVPYTFTKTSQQNQQNSSVTTNPKVSVKVKKSPTITRIDKNILEASANSNINECTFVRISNSDKELYQSYTDIFDIYEKTISYVQLDGKLVTTNDLTNNSNCGLENEYEGQNMFYTFDKKTSTYNPVTTQKGTQNQTTIYAKCISYMKVSSNLNTTEIKQDEQGTRTYSNDQLPRYLMEYEYTEANTNAPSQKSLYYVKRAISDNINAYYPIQASLVSDGSIDYYGYTYVQLSDERLKEIQQASKNEEDCPRIFIHQEYTRKNSYNLNDYTDFDLDNLYTYEGNSIIYEESIGNTDYIFDLDVSGKTIYAKTKETVSENSQEQQNEESDDTLMLFSANENQEAERNVSTVKSDITPMSKEEIEKIYFSDKEGVLDDWSAKNRKEETVTNRMYRYSLPANYEIGSKLDYNGKWKKIDLVALKDILKSDEAVNEYLQELKTNNKLYIKEEGYNEVAPTDIVIGYDVKFYTYEIGKISSSEITKVDDSSKFYADVQKYVNDIETDAVVNSDDSVKLKKINKYGFIDGLEYFTREPIKTVSRDLYYFPSKDYYANVSNTNVAISQDDNTVTTTTENGTTPIIPVAMLKFGDQSFLDFSYKFENTDDIISYIKIRNDLASMLISNTDTCNYVSYRQTDNSPLLSITSNEYEISYESTYYISASIKNGNNTTIDNVFPTISYIFNSSSDSTYEFDWDKIQYYKDVVSHYTLSNEYDNALDVLNYDNKYLYSKYFYPNLTINNGIHKAKDGSYYTSISVFDGTRGTISKSLFLQPNIFNVTEYTYEYTVDAFIEVDADANLKGVTENHYEDYYISMNNEIQRLTPESKSPTYYQNYFANSSANNKLYTYQNKTITAKYDGRSVGPRNDMQIQYFDNVTYEPKIISKDNMLFGIIFRTDLTKFINQDNDNSVIDDMIVDPYSNLFVSPISRIDPTSSYEYTVVNLKEQIDDDNVQQNTAAEIQVNASYIKDITVSEPFYLANEKTIEFTGTYHWNLPEHKNIFKQNSNGEYVAYDIMTNTGYWERDYKIKSIPFAVASYNFYMDPNEVSSTTVSYTFIPESKIVTSVIYHPEISYNFVIRESKEIARFTYFYEGKEYNYPSTNKVQENEDGTYSGAIVVPNGRGGTTSKLVTLNKHVNVDISPVIKKVTHQQEHTTYEYSSYKTSIALTNEKKPVLYSIELVPASSHKVIYWNTDAESYAIRTVVDSNAYYAYNYWYETVPFVTDTYINQKNDLRIAYMHELGQSIDSMTTSINNVLNNSSGSFTSLFNSVDNVATYLNDLKKTQSSVLPNLGTTIENAVTTLSENMSTLVQNINSSYNTSVSDINTYDIYTNIANQTEAIKTHATYLETNIYDLSHNLSYSISKSSEDTVGAIEKLFTDNNQSITYIINKALNRNSKPSYEEFMLELSKDLYTKCDFDTDIIETEQKDENGNILSKTKHKPNPINLAKKSIYRADILWQELKKKNIV